MRTLKRLNVAAFPLRCARRPPPNVWSGQDPSCNDLHMRYLPRSPQWTTLPPLSCRLHVQHKDTHPHTHAATPSPPCNPPPPAIPHPPQWGETVTWPKKHTKHQAPKAPKKKFL